MTKGCLGKEVNNISKYGNKKVQIGNRVFDSLKEARRYGELSMLQERGYITDLECQKKFVLIPKQTDKYGKLVERECAYRADFVYTDIDTGETIVEDVKGYREGTAYNLFSIKRKLLLERYGMRIKEI